MILIHNYKVERDLAKKDCVSNIVGVLQVIDGIPIYNTDCPEEDLKWALDKFKNNYTWLVDANDEFLGIFSDYLDDPGDGNIELILDEINKLSLKDFLSYVTIDYCDKTNKTVNITINILKMVDDLYLKAWGH